MEYWTTQAKQLFLLCAATSALACGHLLIALYWSHKADTSKNPKSGFSERKKTHFVWFCIWISVSIGFAVTILARPALLTG